MSSHRIEHPRHLELVIVERIFEEPVSYDLFVARESCAAWCLEEHGVRPLGSYVSTDSRRMICIYEAPDAEAVRLAQRTAGLPFERAWTATSYSPASDANANDPKS